jgi:outer membrane protein with beta-barrel domain
MSGRASHCRQAVLACAATVVDHDAESARLRETAMKTMATKAVTAFLAVGGLVAGPAAQAQTRPPLATPYAEVGYAWLTISSGGADVSTDELIARMGMDFMPYLGGEIFGGTSASSGNIYDPFSGFNASLKVDNVYGAYLKLHAEIATEFELFARAGWVHSTLQASSAGFQASSSDDSLSFGVGAQFVFADHWYMQGDYTSYYDKHGDTIRGPAVSIGYRF